MAHAIEGYSRLNTGQTIQIKNQKKSTPASKPQTVKKNSSNASGVVYTASRFEDVAKNKSTYTAKATYTNPVLAKKQSTIVQVAQSNKEAAKTTPNALSVAKNFFGGVVDAGVSTAVSLYNLGRHPVQTAKAIGTVIAHPVQTAEAIKEIAVELKDDFKEGNADVKAHMIGRAVGEIGLAIAGAKAVDIGAKALKTFKAAQATANGGKAGVVAEKLSEAAKSVGTAVNVAEEALGVGKVASKSVDLKIIDNTTKGVGEADNFVGILKGQNVTLKNVKAQTIQYTKRSGEELAELRKAFNNTERKNFLYHLSSDDMRVQQLKEAGLSDLDIQMMKDGLVPKGYQVHHKLPLDGGGTNRFDNLILIKNDPYHKVITNTQNALTKDLETGATMTINNWPIPEGYIYPNK